MTPYKHTTIYKIQCIDKNVNECYIGSTKRPINQRIGQHRSCCNNKYGKTYNSKLYSYIRTNGGFENFEFVVLHKYRFISNEDKLANEQIYLDTYNPLLNSCRSYLRQRNFYCL